MKEKGNNGIKKSNEDVGQIISMGTLFVKIPEYCVVSLQLGNHLAMNQRIFVVIQNILKMNKEGHFRFSSVLIGKFSLYFYNNT